ncbi:hypothetical protein SAMN06297280_0668 [Arsukibacterium tuosuense]|uniref:Uncharacterized protein n=1 Tax=Arsukibacterium tuosuense TaxID=1323745 RepID=A0A285I7E1_9GAMM|nr:hypothetical protein [Arsukibacterium tuosuense]SNY43925.1 hypothetical protein SAMN06297280_0668 [Arsukibacterium tuosuense]
MSSQRRQKAGWSDPGHPAQLVVGLIIWSIWFIAMYAGLSVVCQLAPPATLHSPFTWLNGGLFGLTLLVVALLLLLAWRCGRYCLLQRRAKHQDAGVKHFTGYVSTVLYLAAAVATLAGGLPVLVFSPCS